MSEISGAYLNSFQNSSNLVSGRVHDSQYVEKTTEKPLSYPISPENKEFQFSSENKFRAKSPRAKHEEKRTLLEIDELIIDNERIAENILEKNNKIIESKEILKNHFKNGNRDLAMATFDSILLS